MKLFLFTVAASAAAAAASTIDLDDASVDLDTRFEAFVEQFGKSYAGVDEREAAFAAFSENDAKIQDTNNQGLTFTLGHNEFSDLTSEEFNAKYIGSYLDNPNLGREPNYDWSLADPDRVAVTPASIDWTTKGAVTAIKNQGQCGSCWAFSTVMGLEGALFAEKAILMSMSEQDLVSCDHNGDQGCNGGLMDNAFTWVESNGICTEKDYPYTSGTGVTGDCKTSCTPYAKSLGHKDVPKENESALKVAVAQQPVSVAIEADKSVFQLYKSGVLKAASCGTNLDHGVGIVGYGTYTDGTDYWKVKNSWGKTWGMEGYILMARGTNECGISMSASYPVGLHLLGDDEADDVDDDSTMSLKTVSSVTKVTEGVSDPDPPEPAQPQDFVIVVTNFCNTTATLSKQDYNLWEGAYVVDPPDTVASQDSHEFKYGFEVKADPSTARINGTLIYETPYLYVDFFSVEHEWGVMVSYNEQEAAAVVAQADVGNLSVYNILLGQGQDC